MRARSDVRSRRPRSAVGPARGRARRLLAGLAVLLLGCTAPASVVPSSQARGGMVVTSQADATRAGHAMLARGGNAVDAAVAAAFALGVTQPFSAGIGGGAFLLIRTADGQAVALDARETAPAAAERDMYVQPGVPERASLAGPLAVATPGFVAGLALALEQHGTLSLATALAPAIALAEQGFAIGPYHARMLGFMQRMGMPVRFPETARIQFPPPGEAPAPGWRLVQTDLAQTLRRIAAEGPDVFYRGDIAAAIAADQRKNGGLVSEADLAGYVPKLREPVRGRYRELEIFSFPPPSSGGIALIETLNILEGFELSRYRADDPAAVHRIAEAMKLAFADRAAYLGDADFVEVPTERLIAKSYADSLRARIDPQAAIRVEGPGLPQNDAGTTHLSTSDAAGNLVALTMTINTPFGSGMTVPGTGILLNNEMDDFSIAPDTPNVYGLVDTRGANAIAPGKRPLSSMTPTVVLRDGQPFMVTGSPGGPRIITTTLLSILNVVEFGMSIDAAVAAPRFHHQWVPDRIAVEPEFSPDVVDALRRLGHEVEVGQRRWSAAEAILIDPASGLQRGANDPRRDGLALGFDP
jgi:gamma-glutamyltranspeptidase/glutathione hydrolase